MIEIVFTKRNDRVKMFFSRCKELKDALNHICENCRPILNNNDSVKFEVVQSWLSR